MIGRSMVPTYLRYIVPSMIAFTLTSIYGIVDGLFVGNVVGDAGLAGINVSFPLVQFVFAVGTGIGMGGAVISSIRAGRGDEASSRRAVGNTLLMLVVASLPLMAVLLMFGAPLSSSCSEDAAPPLRKPSTTSRSSRGARPSWCCRWAACRSSATGGT